MTTDGPPVETDIGRTLRARRLAAELSQEAVGRRSGLSWVYVAQVERGVVRAGPAVARRLAHALGVEVATLTGRGVVRRGR